MRRHLPGIAVMLLLFATPLAASTLGKAPDFNVTTLDGKTLSLEDLRGKTVVLNFWFAGCRPCIAEMPALDSTTRSSATPARCSTGTECRASRPMC